MNDYIKREDAIEAFDPKQRRDWYTHWIVETLKDLPSADVAPVRHGRWIDDEEFGLELYYAKCSLCGRFMDVHENGGYYNYCPNCGARMDGESDDE